MEQITFIHCGDVHLDARFTGTGLTDNKAKERRQELRDVFSRIIDECITRQVHLLLISGDLFEHEYISRTTITFVMNQLSRIPNIKIFITPGNHDPNVANSYYAMLNWPENVHIFKNKIECITLPEYNVAVYGAGFSQKYQYDSMLNKPLNIRDNQMKTKILLTHGTLDSISEECAYHPICSEQIKDYGFDYVALGHYHAYKHVYDKKIVYCGSPEPLGFDEPEDHGIIVGKINSQKINIEFVKMSKRTYITKEIDITESQTIEEVEEQIKNNMISHRENMMKIILTGKRKKELILDITLLTSRLQENSYYLKIIDDTSSDYDLEKLIKQPNLKGVFVKKMLNAIENATDKGEKEKLNHALQLGLEAMDI